MDSGEYQDIVEEQADVAESQAELQEAQSDSYDGLYSQAKEQSNLYNLFYKVKESNDSVKVANLNAVELGDIWLPERGCLQMAHLAKTLGHKKLAKYFEVEAEIIAKTSMAKKGWFAELFVSQRKFSNRSRGGIQANPGGSKWKLFQRQNTQPEE